MKLTTAWQMGEGGRAVRLEAYLPLKLVNGLNERAHWAVKARRAKEQRAITRMALAGERCWPMRLPAVVTIIRIGPRALDSDGLAASAKHVRDGIADCFGTDDGDGSPITWRYGQRRGKAREYAVEIVIEQVAA